MTARKEFFKKWTTALRSGEYTKIKEQYFTDNSEIGKCYCTLGLAAHVMSGRTSREDLNRDLDKVFVLFPEINPGSASGKYNEIVNRNDGRHRQREHSFPEMADYLEETIKP